jgi:hypothetical protein
MTPTSAEAPDLMRAAPPETATPATRPAGPLICVTYATAGAASLQELVVSTLGFTCTQGTGLLPLCEKAASTWRSVEAPDRGLSALGRSSIRAMVSAMNSIVLASQGGRQWCETAFVHAKVARTFAELLPGSRFLVLHRQCADAIRTAAITYPWGLAGTPLEEYRASSAGLVDAAAAYWSYWTSQLLELEHALGERVMRIRNEDVTADPAGTASRIQQFAGAGRNGVHADSITATAITRAEQTEPFGSLRQVPLDQIPDGLAAQIDKLSGQLGYASLQHSR